MQLQQAVEGDGAGPPGRAARTGRTEQRPSWVGDELEQQRWAQRGADADRTVTANAALGVLAGVLSFIGSIGNVPFAAALWVSGVSFGGVIALIYADLITLPVLDLWRRFLGWKATAYVFVVFFVTMATAAVATEYLFSAFGWIPEWLTTGSVEGFLTVNVDPTLVLAVVSVLGTAALFAVRRGSRDRNSAAA